jgi:hypothetical protein
MTGNLSTAFDGMGTVHQNLGLDYGSKPLLLTEGHIAT